MKKLNLLLLALATFSFIAFYSCGDGSTTTTDEATEEQTEEVAAEEPPAQSDDDLPF